MGEEAGNEGAAALAADLRGETAFALVGEPTRCDIVHTTKGVTWLRLTTRGKSAHSATPGRGDNAIYKMADVIRHIRDELLPELARHPDPILGPSTMNVGLIHGGSKVNIVPDACVVELDIRTVPAQDRENFVAEITARLQQACPTLEVEHLRSHRPLATAPDHPCIARVANLRRSVRGRAPGFATAACWRPAASRRWRLDRATSRRRTPPTNGSMKTTCARASSSTSVSCGPCNSRPPSKRQRQTPSQKKLCHPERSASRESKDLPAGGSHLPPSPHAPITKQMRSPRQIALAQAPRSIQDQNMERYLGKFSLGAFAILRIVSGLMFACHGASKVLGMFADPHMHMPPGGLPPLMVAGGWIELIGGFLIAFGLFGGYAAFICSGQMAVAYFMAHAKGGFFPIVNKGELAVLYCFVFLYIACHGSGVVSLDYLLNRRNARPDPL